MLDTTDTKLLAALQKNAHLTAQELGELLNLSPVRPGGGASGLRQRDTSRPIAPSSIRQNWD